MATLSIPLNNFLGVTKILPHLTYCNLVWHFCKATDKKKLERVNERELRAVFCDWNLAYEDLVKRANLFSLYNMRLQDIAIFMYKVKHRLLPSNVVDLFRGTPSGCNLRNSDFHISRIYSVHYGKHYLRYLGPYLWSKLGQTYANSDIIRLKHPQKRPRKPSFKLRLYRELSEVCLEL